METRLATQAAGPEQWRVESIGAGYQHAALLRIGMVGWQSTTPGKGESQGGDARAKCEAIGVISTTAPVIDRVAELDYAAHAVRSDMESSGIRHRQMCAAGHSRDRGRTHLQPDAGHFECSGRARSRWPYQRGVHLIRAGHDHTARCGIGMIYRQRAAPGKDEGSGHLARGEIEAGIALSAPIIDGIAEFDQATGTARRGMERRRVGHRYLRAATHTGYRRRADRHVYRGHFERH